MNNPLKYIDPSGYDYWVTNEGLNDAGEYWYCVYSDSDYSDLLGIVTGGSELEAKFGQETMYIKNDESAIESQHGTIAYQKALDQATESGYSTYYEFYGGFDCGVTFDDTNIKPATGFWGIPVVQIFCAGLGYGIEFSSSDDSYGSGAGKEPVTPLGKGHTGRYKPINAIEKSAMNYAMSNPWEGKQISLRKGMNDSRWLGSEGWQKMAMNVNGVEIHYNYNSRLGVYDDFKFK